MSTKDWRHGDPSKQPTQFSFDLAGQNPTVDIPGGGTILEANASTFPALQGNGLAVYLLTLEPGAVRIPHWHPDSSEVQYMLQGQAHIGLITPAQGTGPGADCSYDLTPGMIGVAPQGWFHYIQNTGTETAVMLIIFNNQSPDNVDITWAFDITSPELLQQCFGISFQGMSTSQIWISPPSGG